MAPEIQMFAKANQANHGPQVCAYRQSFAAQSLALEDHASDEESPLLLWSAFCTAHEIHTSCGSFKANKIKLKVYMTSGISIIGCLGTEILRGKMLYCEKEAFSFSTPLAYMSYWKANDQSNVITWYRKCDGDAITCCKVM